MKKILIASFALFAFACQASPAENAESSVSEVGAVRTVAGAPSCSSWACAHGARPVKDEEIFAIALKYETQMGPSPGPGPGPSTSPSTGTSGSSAPPSTGSSGSSTPPSTSGGSSGALLPLTVQLAAIECGQIHNSCEAMTCTIRTTCGGGGPVEREEARTLSSWLQTHGAYTENYGWAKRSLVRDVICKRQPGGTRCRFTQPPSPGPVPGPAPVPTEPSPAPTDPTPVPQD